MDKPGSDLLRAVGRFELSENGVALQNTLAFMNGNARGLVYDQKFVVFENDVDRFGRPRAGLRLLVGNIELDAVARAGVVLRRRVPAVQAHAVFAEELPYISDVKALLEVIFE